MEIAIREPEGEADFQMKIEEMRNQANIDPANYFEAVEENLKQTEKHIQEQLKLENKFCENLLKYQQQKRVLIETKRILADKIGALAVNQEDYSIGGGSINDEGTAQPLIGPRIGDYEGGINIQHVAGTINTDEVQRFQRLIFRASRGNALTHFAEFPHSLYDYHDNALQKTVYVVLF